MKKLPRCMLCKHGSDPRFGHTMNGALYPLCDGCGGPETQIQLMKLETKLLVMRTSPLAGDPTKEEA